MKDRIQTVFHKESQAFKITMSLGFILRHVTDGRYRYFIPHHNCPLLDYHVSVSSISDLKHVYKELAKANIRNYTYRDRTSTSWKLAFVCSINILIYRTNYSLGDRIVPDHIKNHHAIHTLDKRTKGKPYEDQLCAFRCLVVHWKQTQLAETVHTYYDQCRKYMPLLELPENYEEFQDLSPDDFHDFPWFWNLFPSKSHRGRDQEGNVTVFHHSTTKHKDQLYLNMYGSHLSFFTSFQAYAKKYKCWLCEHLFSQMFTLKQPSRVCVTRPVFILFLVWYSKN